MLFNTDFESAFYDYQYLLEKKYTEKNILKLIGDRYKLNTVQRSLLYRGVTTNEKALMRKRKKITEKELFSKTLHIDTYNLLLTINSYLKGKPVFISYDGYVRDAGILKAKVGLNASFDRSLQLVITYLNTVKLNEHYFYIDLPVTNSKELKKQILNSTKQVDMATKVIISNEVDKKLAVAETGVIATADTGIIDNTLLNIFDLAKNTLKFHFNAQFVNLQNIVNK